MQKYLSWFGLIPLTLVTMVFLTEKELHEKCCEKCFGLLLGLIVYSLLYFMLLHLQVNKWIAISIAFFLWILAFFVKKQLYD